MSRWRRSLRRPWVVALILGLAVAGALAVVSVPSNEPDDAPSLVASGSAGGSGLGTDSPGGAGDAGAVLVSYSRSGGAPPSDAERLTISGAGAFDLHRTVGTTRVGWFTGELRPSQLGALREIADGLRGSYHSPDPVAPDTVTERITVGSFAAGISDDAGLPEPWRLAVAVVRPLLDSLTDSPKAAIELRASDRALSAQLRHLGDDAVAIAGPSIAIEVSTVDGRGRTVAQWQSTDPLAVSLAATGWTYDLALGRSGLTAASGESYEVTVELELVGADGVTRTARLSVSAASK